MGVSEPGFMQKMTRYLFIGFNVLFTIFGLGLLIAGSVGVAKAKTLDWDDLKEVISLGSSGGDAIQDEQAARAALAGIAGVVVAIGLITMIISSCGWIGACKQNTCLLFSFSVFMGIIVLLEFILGIAVLVVVKKFADPNDKDTASWINALITEAETEYNAANSTTKALTDAFDQMQINGDCCGLRGPSDWDKSQIPPSCYPEKDINKAYFEVGCFEAYGDTLILISKGVGGVAIGFCVIEIFGLIISCYLACNMKKGTPYEQH